MSITTKPFGIDQIGRVMTLYTMKNKQGAEVSVLDYGAHIVSIKMPDKNNQIKEISLGFDTLPPYEKEHACIGATIGRYANRIGKAQFNLNGKTYELFQNENKNCLHGGRENFQYKWFKGDTLQAGTEDAVLFTYVAHDMEEGFPGKLTLQVSFALDNENNLTISYLAKSTEDTVINLTNHVYFNLKGQGNILTHILKVDADTFTETDDELIPTGHILPVDNTPYDLKNGMTIQQGLDLMSDPVDSTSLKGYDVNFCLNNTGYRKVAELFEQESGRKISVHTDQPGMQVYSGQGLNFDGANGVHFGPYYGIALETQHYADSPNHDNFPSTLLKKDEVFSSKTCYQFEVVE